MDKKILRNLSYGMYIIGSKTDRNIGCIANTVFQITSNPAIIAVSINHENETNKAIKESNIFSVSILPESISQEIIGTFGYHSSKDIDKYESVETVEVAGLPVLKESCGSFVCKVVNQIETTTHTVFLGEVIATGENSDKIPMTYRYYHEVLKGKSPKKAPTFIEEEKKSVWKCSVCGYEVEMDELPDDYRCPICGKTKEFFKKQ